METRYYVAVAVTRPALAEETPTVRRIIFALSGFVMLLVLVVMALAPSGSGSAQPTLLAQLNVILNGSAGLALLAGFAFIRARNVAWHKRCMVTAFALSSLFLVSYVLNHAQVG